MAGNTIHYGLSKAYYAVLTEGETDTYATPVAIPNAVAINLAAVGEVIKFEADNMEHEIGDFNDGYDGTLEVIDLPESFYIDVLGEVEDSKKVLFEKIDVEKKYIALLFRFEGDVKGVDHVMYRCSVARPDIASKTTRKKEPSNITLKITSRPNRAGRVKSKTKSDTDATVVSNWYTAVQTFVAGE